MAIEVENLGAPYVEEKDFVVACLGPTQLESGGIGLNFMPFRCQKSARYNFAYDWEQYNANFLPLAPAGVQGITGIAQAFFVANLQPAISGVSNISNVTNLFSLTSGGQPYEALQCFIGVAPSYLRVYIQQPPNAGPVGSMDQNIIPQTTFYDSGYFDGFASPYDAPTKAGQVLVLAGTEPWFTLANPVSVLVDPHFNLFFNRMLLSPVVNNPNAVEPKNRTLATAVVMGLLPRTHFISIGNPFNGATVNPTSYPGAQVVTVAASGTTAKALPPGGGSTTTATPAAVEGS
jgi:hypothetical protein